MHIWPNEVSSEKMQNSGAPWHLDSPLISKYKMWWNKWWKQVKWKFVNLDFLNSLHLVKCDVKRSTMFLRNQPQAAVIIGESSQECDSKLPSMGIRVLDCLIAIHKSWLWGIDLALLTMSYTRRRRARAVSFFPFRWAASERVGRATLSTNQNRARCITTGARKTRRVNGGEWGPEVVRSLKLSNVWVFFRWFSVLACLQISCTKTQTFPNLRLLTTSGEGEGGDDEDAAGDDRRNLRRFVSSPARRLPKRRLYLSMRWTGDVGECRIAQATLVCLVPSS